jgi:hypothetical protein
MMRAPRRLIPCSPAVSWRSIDEQAAGRAGTRAIGQVLQIPQRSPARLGSIHSGNCTRLPMASQNAPSEWRGRLPLQVSMLPEPLSFCGTHNCAQ